MSDFLTSAEKLSTMEFPDNEKWLIDKIFPNQSIMMLSAAPKSFKTWLVLHIASCVARGEPLFGKFKVEQKNVLFIDEENGLRLLQERIKLMGISDKNLYFSSFRGTKIDDQQDRYWLWEKIEKAKIGLIICDTFVRIHGKEENDASKMREIFADLQAFLFHGISFLFTHHQRKESPYKGANSNGSQMLRGSSEISAFINCLFSITVKDRDEGVLLLRNDLMRNSRSLEDLAVKISIDDSGARFELLDGLSKFAATASENKKVVLNVLAAQKIPMTLTDLEEGSDIKKPALRSILSDLADEGLIKNETGPHNTAIYSLKDESPVL